jgi:acetyl-CoA C-acetyltransferase
MGRKVAIVGFGSTDNSDEARRKDDLKPWRTKVADAFYNILESVDKGIDLKDIQYVVTNYHGESSVEGGSPAELIDALGLAPIGHSLITDQCTGSGTSLFDAYAIVASGLCDVVLIIGWDSRYDSLNRAEKRSLQSNVDFDYHFGYDHYHATDMFIEYFYRWYGKREVLEAFVTYVIQQYWYANRTPKAAWYGHQCPIKKDELLALLDSGDEAGFWRKFKQAVRYVSCDGASGVILVPAEDAKKYTDTPVYIEGVSQKNTPNYVGWPTHYPVKRYDWAAITHTPSDKMCHIISPASWISTEEAFKMAKIEPKDVDFAEVFDLDLLHLPLLETLRVCPRFGAVKFIIDGETAIDGRLPCGTNGGVGGFGKASGADFSNMLVEAVIQLRGEAGQRQVPKHDIAVVKSAGGVGGGGAMSSTAVLRRG